MVYAIAHRPPGLIFLRIDCGFRLLDRIFFMPLIDTGKAPHELSLRYLVKCCLVEIVSPFGAMSLLPGTKLVHAPISCTYIMHLYHALILRHL